MRCIIFCKGFFFEPPLFKLKKRKNALVSMVFGTVPTCLVRPIPNSIGTEMGWFSPQFWSGLRTDQNRIEPDGSARFRAKSESLARFPFLSFKVISFSDLSPQSKKEKNMEKSKINYRRVFFYFALQKFINILFHSYEYFEVLDFE